jgi:hypothetical protein
LHSKKNCGIPYSFLPSLFDNKITTSAIRNLLDIIVKKLIINTKFNGNQQKIDGGKSRAFHGQQRTAGTIACLFLKIDDQLIKD